MTHVRGPQKTFRAAIILHAGWNCPKKSVG